MAAESLFLQAPVASGLFFSGQRINLVPNPSFELDSQGWVIDNTGWTGPDQRRVAISPFGVSSGGFGFYMAGTKDANSTQRFLDVASEPIAVSPSTTYAFSAALLAADPPNGAGGNGASIAIAWYTSADAYISSDFGAPISTPGTYRPTLTVSSPANAAKCMLYLRQFSQTSGDTTACFWDSILFEYATVIGSYFDGNSLGCEWLGQPHRSASSVSPTLSLTDQTVWKIEDFDLDNPVPRDVFVADVDRDGSRPMMEPRWDNRQPSFGLRMSPQASGDDVLATISALEGYLSAARRVAKEAPVDPIDYVRLVWTPQDSTKSYFIPVYGGHIEGIDRSDLGWALRTPKITVQMTADPAGYGSFATFLSPTNLTANFITPVTVPAVAGDLPPWTKVTVADAAGVDRGLVRIGVRQNDPGTFFQVGGSAINVTGYDSSYTGGFVQFNTWTDGRYRAVGAVPSQTATGKFRVYAVGCRANPGTKMRFSYATKNGSRRRLDAVDIGTGGNSGSYFEDFFLGEVNADQAWDSWLETNGGAGIVWDLVFLPVDSFVEVVGPASGENLAGATAQADAFGTSATHLNGKALDTGGTWALSGTNIASPTWPVAGGITARSTIWNAAPSFARAGNNNSLDLSVECRLVPGTPLSWSAVLDQPRFGVFARYSSITNFLVAGLSTIDNTYMRPGVWACVSGVYYPLWQGASVKMDPAIFDIELQTTADGRWWVRLDQLATGTFARVGRQEASGSHGILRSGGALGGATAGHGLFDWQDGGTANVRTWDNYRQRSLVGVTPLPLLANKDLAWNDAVLMVDNNTAEYPYAGASGIELRPGVPNALNLMVRRNAELNDSPGLANDTSTNIKVEGYERFLTVPQ